MGDIGEAAKALCAAISSKEKNGDNNNNNIYSLMGITQQVINTC